MHTDAQTIENKDLEQPTTAETNVPESNKDAKVAEEPLDSEKNELEKMAAEAADWKDKYVRLYADFENFRHRTAKEKVALIATASEGLMKDLLPVVDDFERSLKAMETAQDVESLKEGVGLIYHKLMKTLGNKGLTAIESIGKPFDAELQEAVTQIPAPSEDLKGCVVDELEKGYFLNDKTIRFAKVVIGS